MEEQGCISCLYWYKTFQEEYGRCKRYPPIRLDSDKYISEFLSEFPFTYHDDRCGEYKSNKLTL